MRLLFAILLACALPMDAANYWVDSQTAGASDSNPGTQAAPWLTVAKAATVASAGDVVRVVGPATYSERVVLTQDGSATNYTVFIGTNSPTLRGFWCNAASYVKIIGFRFSHGSTTYPYEAIRLENSSYIHVLDNTFYEVSSGIYMGYNKIANNCLIRGNNFDKVGIYDGLTTSSPAIQLAGTNNIIEYNEVTRAGDSTRIWGTQNVVRNNYFHGFYPADIDPDPHVDFLQSWSISGVGSSYLLFENNLCVSNLLGNSHGFLLRQDTPADNLDHFIFRGNVYSHLGENSTYIENFSWVNFVHNTVYNANALGAGTANSTTETSTNLSYLNNIYSDINEGTASLLYNPDGTTSPTFLADYDLAYNCGPWGVTEGNSLTNDPLFTLAATNNFRLLADSPAISGGALTGTVGAGTNSTSIVVSNATLFTDGWGIVSGDVISVGTNTGLTVTDVDYSTHTITVGTAIDWAAGDAVKLSILPDRGALPYLADWSISPLLTVDGTNYTVTVNSNLVRMVVFSENGLPVETDTASPYAYTSSGGVVTAMAYPLYADHVLGYSASTQVLVLTFTGPTYKIYPTPWTNSATATFGTNEVEGTFDYSITNDTVLTVGSWTNVVSFAPTDTNTYSATSANVMVTVGQGDPGASWDAPASIWYPTALSALQLNATSTQPATITYSYPVGTVLDPGVWTLIATVTPTNSNYATVSTNQSLIVQGVRAGSASIRFGATNTSVGSILFK